MSALVDELVPYVRGLLCHAYGYPHRLVFREMPFVRKGFWVYECSRCGLTPVIQQEERPPEPTKRPKRKAR